MIKEVVSVLENNSITYEIEYHQAVYTMEEMQKCHLKYEHLIAKNLFLSDDKKKNYYLICVYGDKKIDLKNIKEIINSRSLSFASENDLHKYLSLSKGSVTPFGILNDKEHMVHLYIDKVFSDKLIGVHPNVNTATIYLKTNDLMDLIKKLGNEVQFINI